MRKLGDLYQARMLKAQVKRQQRFIIIALREYKSYYPLCEEIIIKKNAFKASMQIDRTSVTHATLAGIGGMIMFISYMSDVGRYPSLQSFFWKYQKG